MAKAAKKAKPKTVDAYLDAHPDHRETLDALRAILGKLSLEETVKWSAPCYTHDGTNVVMLVAFKAYAGLWFFQGALLDDPDGVLVAATEDKTKAQRQWRFESPKEVKPARVRAYVKEAIALAADGKEIKPDRNRAIEIPAELAAALAKDKKAAAAFDALTPGKQRAYADHVAEAKRPATRESRVAKALPLIRKGQGLHDKYRDC